MILYEQFLKEREQNGSNSEYKIWAIVPGKDGFKWQEFQSDGIISIGWGKLGDITQYDTRDEINAELKDKYNYQTNPTNTDLALWQFCHEIHIGDTVYAKTGRKTLLGVGKVTSDYIFDDTKDEFNNIRQVEWLQTGSWTVPSGEFAVKALTDITSFAAFCKTLENTIEENIILHENISKLTKAKFVKWFEPIISALKQLNGSGTPKQVRELIIVRFRLDENTLANTVGKSKTNEFENDVAWARNYLKDEGYIDGSKNGVWKLTERGWHVQMNDELASRIFFKWVEILKCKREGKPIPEIDITIFENILVNNSYTKKDFLSDVFMESESYDTLKALLMRKKNVILQGAPGVGKTFAAKRLAYSVLGGKDDARIMSVQFHQSYSYEDFIMGYRPDGNGFSLKYGVFYKFCKLAENNPDKPYFFIIDEINRGNLSKIFGELLMLVECDKRGDKMTLTYSETPFSVPDNLYIIGMMNTADRSLAIIDYALRRRFCFFELEPAYATVSFQNHLVQNGLPLALSQKIISKIIAVNAEIARDPNLGKGFRIGHSYFCDCKDSNDNWYEDIIRYEIAPLLREYWFDETEKDEECIGGLLR
jgi:5-methylcytosine-specific restriction protein B